MISIFGTLVTDNLTDNMGVPLEVSTIVFSVVLALTFAIWYAKEKTLNIHSIFTKRREFFYWLTILFTFALGTASGDLMAESLGLGYLVTGVIVCVVIASMVVAYRFGLNPVLAFWIAYIMTRPLGASLGDYLSQAQKYGGLGLGPTVTSIIFLLAILLTVIFLSVTKRDLIAKTSTKAATDTKQSVVFLQVVVVVCALVIVAGTGYYWRHATLQNEAKTLESASSTEDSSSGLTSESPLGDLSNFSEIEEDTLRLVNAGDLSGAKSRVDDLEYTWDNAEAKLKPMNQAKWIEIDDSIDKVLRELRAVYQDAEACKASLESSLAVLNGLQNESNTSVNSVSSGEDSSSTVTSADPSSAVTPADSSSAVKPASPKEDPSSTVASASPKVDSSSAVTSASPKEDSSSTVTSASSKESSSSTVAKTSPLGDLSSFRKIEEDTLSLVNSGNLSGAKSRVNDLESAWDDAEVKLKPMNSAKWTEIDDSIDKVLSRLRAKNQDAEACKASLVSALAVLN